MTIESRGSRWKSAPFIYPTFDKETYSLLVYNYGTGVIHSIHFNIEGDGPRHSYYQCLISKNEHVGYRKVESLLSIIMKFNEESMHTNCAR